MEDDTTAARITPEFDSVLRYLRTLAEPCLPPMGVGGFDVLYASAREVVVWYSPARDGRIAGEVAIPAWALSAAWQSLSAGTLLDDGALADFGLRAGSRQWVMALLAQIPGVQVRQEPLALVWMLSPESPTPSNRIEDAS
ncbi:MAG TPA: hypothetical protein VFU63_02890 [Ktedonobacterales bacterium]|nr:hypothetical protein [Ktedonobacterales bacterium]